MIFGICLCARTPGLCHGKDRISIRDPRLTYLQSDNCGINITPVIARVFKKAVYNTFVKEAVVENLSTTQFAYCVSGNCISALLAIQHFINKHLDNPDCEAVRGRVVIEVTGSNHAIGVILNLAWGPNNFSPSMIWSWRTRSNSQTGLGAE